MTGEPGGQPSPSPLTSEAPSPSPPTSEVPSPSPPTPAQPKREAELGWAPEPRARVAARVVFTVFALNGFIFASWVSRLPAVRDQLQLSASQLGLVLLIGAAGALVALPLSGTLISRIGTANATRISALWCAAGLTSAAVAVGAGSTPHVAISSFAAAMGIGAWDVSMNVQGAVVEHTYRRAMLPRFHAGFSLGAVLGAASGAAAAGAGLSATTHVILTSSLAAVCAVVAVAGYLPDGRAALGSALSGPSPQSPPPTNGFSSWGERRTVLIGLVALAAALTEGSANDWLALAVVDGFGTQDAIGALAFAFFVLAMTVMRLVGTRLLDRFGRVVVLRASSALALVGLLVFGFAPSLPIAMVGAAAWGLGSSLGFPVGMSAAADDPARAAARVSVVSTIGYLAFLAGPPLLGLLADEVGYRHAIVFIALPVVVGLAFASAAAPLAEGDSTADA